LVEKGDCNWPLEKEEARPTTGREIGDEPRKKKKEQLSEKKRGSQGRKFKGTEGGRRRHPLDVNQR